MKRLSCLLPALALACTIHAQFSISYPGSPYCAASGLIAALTNLPSGGSFSATPVGLDINPVSGDIDLGSSSPGTYQVSYTAGQTTFVTIRPGTLLPPVANQFVCAGTTLSNVSFNGPEGISYSWQNTNPGIGLPSSGTGSLPGLALLNAGTSVESAHINVTTSGGTGCIHKTMSFTVSVKPVPAMSAVPDNSFCAGVATTPISFTGTIPGTYFSWTNNNTFIGIPASGTNTIASFTARNNTNSVQTAHITITPVAAACSGPSQTMDIMVQPAVQSLSYNASAYCPVGTTRPILRGSAGGVFSSTPAGLTLDASSGSIVLASSQASTYTVTYTVNTIGCTSTGSAILSVNGQTSVTPVLNQILCGAETTNPVIFTGTSNQYAWTNSNTSINLGASGTDDITDFVAINNSNVIQTAVIRVTPLAFGGLCEGKPMVFVIKVKPNPEVTNLPATAHLCRGVVVAPYILTSSLPNTTFTWESNNAATGFTTLTGSGATLPGFTTANPTAGTISTEVIVYVSANKCDGDALLFRYFIDNCGSRHIDPRDDGSTTRSSGLQTTLISVAPNPVRSTLVISYEGSGRTTVEIRDAFGQVVLPPRSLYANTSIDVSGFLPGVYSVVVTDPIKGTQVQRRIVKL
jgi:hypothetical protein